MVFAIWFSTTWIEPSCIFHGNKFTLLDYILLGDEIWNCCCYMHLFGICLVGIWSWSFIRWKSMFNPFFFIKISFFSSEMVVVFGQRFDWRDAERKRSNIYQDIRGLSPSIDQMVDLSWPLVSPQDCLTLLMKEHPTRLREMKQQCDSQNANPRSDSKSRDPMKSGDVAKIESESRSSSYGSGVKRSGSETNRNDHDTNRPPESKRIKTEQPRPDVKSEFTDDKKWVLFFICLSSSNLL